MREGGRGVHRLTSCSSPLPSLLPSPMQRGSAVLMTFSGEPAHHGPSPLDARRLPRHSGSGEKIVEEGREGGREGGQEGVCVCYHQGDSLNFLPLAQITTDFHHNALSKLAL